MFPPQKLSLHASNKVHVGRAGLATPATFYRWFALNTTSIESVEQIAVLA